MHIITQICNMCPYFHCTCFKASYKINLGNNTYIRYECLLGVVCILVHYVTDVTTVSRDTVRTSFTNVSNAPHDIHDTQATLPSYNTLETKAVAATSASLNTLVYHGTGVSTVT